LSRRRDKETKDPQKGLKLHKRHATCVTDARWVGNADEKKSTHLGGEGMNKKIKEELAAELRRRRYLLFREVVESENDVRAIIEDRDSELEENAQKERIATVTRRLTERDQNMIRQINAAIERMEAGVYGECEDCGGEIGVARLRALPTAALCIDCATQQEKRQRTLVPERTPESYFMVSGEAE
jgi:DnaK suppressor protein